MLQSESRPKPIVIDSKLKGKTFKFGLVSDSHLGSKFEALNELHTFYEICKKSGVDFMVHSGDLVDGSASMHKGFLYDLHKLGADEQIQHVIDNYPSIGVKTYYVLGNHCLSHEKTNGTNIARPISAQRDDMIYLGDVEADVNISGIKIRLYHAG
jgi:predicted phosphodiesterase